MAGITPNEGEVYIAGKVYVNGDLEIGLFSAPASPTESTVWADITEPSTFGYARQTLSAWTAASTSTHTQVTFTPSGGDWTGIYGYFIKPVGTNTVVHIEVKTGAPDDITDGSNYNIDLSNVTD